jgi:hypothetical protein
MTNPVRVIMHLVKLNQTMKAENEKAQRYMSSHVPVARK